MHELIFATLAVPGKAELDTLLLAESLRNFGGDLASCHIWVVVPSKLGPLSDSTLEKLAQLDAWVIQVETDTDTMQFPFASKVLAAAAIERQAQGQTKRLVYLDGDTIVLQAPAEFLISSDQAFGYRPVHHRLIGASWGQAPDPFWESIYEICDVPNENLFEMTTHTGEKIYPYFNAGMFITRPKNGLMRAWQTTFLKWFQQPRFKFFYQKDQLYAIFMHQAIFSGVLLKNLQPGEMCKLSPKINYPLHLHDEIPIVQRATTIDQLITVRYENIFDEPGWRQLPFSESLKNWLASQDRLQA